MWVGKLDSLPFFQSRPVQADTGYSPYLYPVNWKTVDDEELPFLDRRLLGALNESGDRRALERLSAMIMERRRRLQAAARNGAVPGGTVTMRSIKAFSDGVREAFQWKRRTHRPLEEQALNELATRVLELVQGLVDRRLRVHDGRAFEASPASDDELQSAFATLASMFSAFNAAYLLPCQAYQADVLAAAAWLGWKLEGLHAPLPPGAEVPLRTAMLLPVTAFDPSDPYSILRFGLNASGITPRNLNRNIHQEWPAPQRSLNVRPYRTTDIGACEELLAQLSRHEFQW